MRNRARFILIALIILASGSCRLDISDGLNKLLAEYRTLEQLACGMHKLAGEFETSFAGTGYTTFDNAGTQDMANGAVFDAAGRIIVVGVSNSDMAIWRYTSAGMLDTTFGGGDGIVTHDNAAGGSGSDFGYSIALDRFGNLVIVGSSMSASIQDMVIWRYTSNGVLDTSFGASNPAPGCLSGGCINHNIAAGGSGDDVGYSLTLDSSGNIYVTGYSNNGTNKDMVIWRYTSNGVLDTSFGASNPAPGCSPGGCIINDNAAGGITGDDEGKSITLDSSENIYVTGSSDNGANDADMVIWRYTSNGVLDPTFAGGDGIAVDNNTGDSERGSSIILDNSGNIISSGTRYNGSNMDMAIWRYTSDGVLDTNFGSGEAGYIVHDNAAGGAAEDEATKVALDEYGNIILTGYSNNGSDYDMVVWRYTSSGVLDTTFGNGEAGYIVHDNAAGGTAGNDVGMALLLDSCNYLYAVGYSETTPASDMAIWKYR